MCFMFGADKEHVHRMLGLIAEEQHEEEVTDAEEVPATSAREVCSQD